MFAVSLSCFATPDVEIAREDDLAGTGLAERATTNTTTPIVFAHHIVGNTYNYTTSIWAKDIALAASKGISAFALNVGSDSWEPQQVANAYAAAKSNNTNFKLFVSLDMTSLPCSSASNIASVQSYIKSYASHPNQFLYNGKVFLSTFSGESCKFGASSVNQGWINAVKTNVPSVYFVPSFFVAPNTFSTYSVIDGMFNWNSGWPMGNYSSNFTSDAQYISALGSKSYMAAQSPWFFTHYGVNSYNKNFIYRGDDWLFSQRWETLIANRTKVPFTEVVSWNDYGESHYIGPIEGQQPNSQAWVNGFDHQGWFDLMTYYITAYQTGKYPTISKDRVFLWARLYPVNATAPLDTVGKPTNYQLTQDYLWGVTLLMSPANVTLSCGSTTNKTLAPAGLTKFKLPLSTNCSVTAVVVRGTNTTVNFAPPSFKFNTKPPSYNFNAFVAASP
ncbi:Glucan endo-1,3-alpha-glucosidase agn1 [Sparassis crispa]|uniref:Glucan endo-1,3-alpha-glucosidase agn1 n=1 Tax=Sparassis crispa TaxID=139825 RepID=A0A401G8Q5_9APHY|nr:Glucan endo-1,3-alpha-glucosidase agn1 [Sparassis crispa]GBE78542.1 Glucan endo-1,3-alpha-glucosidase agn1 [Sparassis crispa]